MKFEIGQEYVIRMDSYKHLVKIINVTPYYILYKYIWTKSKMLEGKTYQRTHLSFKKKILNISLEEFKLQNL